MDHALAQTGTAVAPGSMLSALPARSRWMLAAGSAGLLAVVVALALWGNKGDYKVLYANLAEKDGGAIIAQLSQMNIPYRHADGGNAILVPASQVHDARLKLATAGLPKGGVVGFELMDNARFGQTQFQERLTFQRGLEGELTRSIGALGSVQSARVHLALPNQNGFFREQQKPSASVLLTLHAGRVLDRSQIAGIVHLVSSSVPELNPKAVSVLDQTGSLLSGPGEAAGSQAAGLDAHQLQYVAQVETSYVRRVIEILEPVVGRDNLRATVAADVDFSHTEATSEVYKPNQGAEPAAVRSQQSSEAGLAGAAMPSGVPGAASNQPPVAATAPLTGASSPLQAAAGGSVSGNARRDNVTNYEVDKTVRVTRAASGNIKRLAAAVVVNHRVTTAPNGKISSTPLPAEELEKLTALVQESIGYSKERGDSVKLINAPFRVPAVAKVEPLPLWQQDGLIDLVRSLGMPVAMSAVALLIVLGLLRPAFKAASTPVGGAARPSLHLVAGDADAPPLPNSVRALAPPRNTAQLDGARAIARQNPAAAAHIVRTWVNGEA